MAASRINLRSDKGKDLRKKSLTRIDAKKPTTKKRPAPDSLSRIDFGSTRREL
jgi:hypothetical protein